MKNIRKIFSRKKSRPNASRIDYTLRFLPEKSDCIKVREILQSTGFFSEEEMAVAIELIEEKLSLGEKSTYRFIFIESAGKLLGYSCFGLIPMTRETYDLYWIAVDPNTQGYGIGKILMGKTEDLIKESGGAHIYAETASRKQYLPTRKFYLSCGYKKAGYFPDFYSPGDGKVVFYKKI